MPLYIHLLCHFPTVFFSHHFGRTLEFTIFLTLAAPFIYGGGPRINAHG
jgi:hypothetical protein